MNAARRKQNDFDLDKLGPEDSYLTEEQFGMIKDQIDKIQQSLEDEYTKIQSLKIKLNNLLKKEPTY